MHFSLFVLSNQDYQDEGYDKFLPNHHIADPGKEGKKHDHINKVVASSSKFNKQGRSLFFFFHAFKRLR